MMDPKVLTQEQHRLYKYEAARARSGDISIELLLSDGSREPANPDYNPLITDYSALRKTGERGFLAFRSEIDSVSTTPHLTPDSEAEVRKAGHLKGLKQIGVSDSHIQAISSNEGWKGYIAGRSGGKSGSKPKNDAYLEGLSIGEAIQSPSYSAFVFKTITTPDQEAGDSYESTRNSKLLNLAKSSLKKSTRQDNAENTSDENLGRKIQEAYPQIITAFLGSN